MYKEFVAGGGLERVSEKGILQLLFDVRFLSDILAGGYDPDKDPSPSLGGTRKLRVNTAVCRCSISLCAIHCACGNTCTVFPFSDA